MSTDDIHPEVLAFRELLQATPEPQFGPPATPVASMPKLTEPGLLRQALQRPPDADELAMLERQRKARHGETPVKRSHAAPDADLSLPAARKPVGMPGAPLPPMVPPPRYPPGFQLFVQYVKMKADFTLEYRKDGEGKSYLHHAEPHLMEQLKNLPCEQHKAHMKKMRYTYVKWYEST